MDKSVYGRRHGRHSGPQEGPGRLRIHHPLLRHRPGPWPLFDRTECRYRRKLRACLYGRGDLKERGIAQRPEQLQHFPGTITRGIPANEEVVAGLVGPLRGRASAPVQYAAALLPIYHQLREGVPDLYLPGSLCVLDAPFTAHEQLTVSVVEHPVADLVAKTLENRIEFYFCSCCFPPRE